MTQGPMFFGVSQANPKPDGTFNNAGGDITELQSTISPLYTLLVRYNQTPNPPWLASAIETRGADIGVLGEGRADGVWGKGVSPPEGNFAHGVHGFTDVQQSNGVIASGGPFGDGVLGYVGTPGSKPASTSNAGVIGKAGQNNGNGVIGEAHNGINAYGVWGRSQSGYAGRFDGKMIVVGQSLFFGDVQVFGKINKSALTFKIDHPLDPENKYLLHSGVESSDMKNVYDGTCRLDDEGSAWIELPEWFGELNRDCRYQLTAIGEPAPELHIAEEISENRFRIAGGTAGMKVSWQVTGIRKDAWAERNRIVVEEDKPEEARGTYLHPEAFGQPDTRREGYAREEEASARQEESRSRLEEISAQEEELKSRYEEERRETEPPGPPEGGEGPEDST